MTAAGGPPPIEPGKGSTHHSFLPVGVAWYMCLFVLQDIPIANNYLYMFL